MSAPDPRKMALQIAGLRANETHLPPDERVFEDPYAEFFFDEETRRLFRDPARVKAERARYEQMMPGVNGAIVARIRYIDEVVDDAARQGARQLVIIGAGYDTRAYRIPGVGERMRVFEVDHPLTQEVKTAVVATLFEGLPRHVAYVPVVFGADRLGDRLAAAGYEASLQTLFLAEGLLMYIAPPAVDGLLAFVTGNSAPGSVFCADYFSSSVVAGTSELPEARALRQFVAAEGAPLRFGIAGGGAGAFFECRGFAPVETVSAPACGEKYFSGGSRGRRVSPMFNFVRATVADR